MPVPIHTLNLGIVQSAANIIFMAGENRSATPNSHFLFHQTKYSPNTGGNYSPADLSFNSASVKLDDSRTAEIMAQRTNKPLTEVKRWFVGQKLRTTDFALANGIIQNIEHLRMPMGSEFFQITL